MEICRDMSVKKANHKKLQQEEENVTGASEDRRYKSRCRG